MLKISILGLVLFLFSGNDVSAKIDFDITSDNYLSYLSVNNPPEANEGLRNGFNLSVHINKPLSLIPKINSLYLTKFAIKNSFGFYSPIHKIPVNTYLLFRQLLI